MLLRLDVDFQVEMYLAKSSQFYMGDHVPFIEIQHRIGFHGLNAFIDRFQFRCNVDDWTGIHSPKADRAIGRSIHSPVAGYRLDNS